MAGNPIDISLLKEALKLLSTPHNLDNHVLSGWLVDDYLRQHPEQTNVGRGELLGWALASLWRERYMPQRLAPEFARDWNNFLVLEVACFYPFRKAKRVRGGLIQSTFPDSLAQTGVLLADKEHLAAIIGDPYISRLTNPAEVPASLLTAIVPDQKDREKGAILVTTVAARRDIAVKKLAEELSKLRTTSTTSAPVASASSHVAPAAVEISAEPSTDGNLADLESVTFDNFLLIDWWVKERFRQTRPAVDTVGLQEKARRLAEFLAALQLQIESGPEPTPKLIRWNVNRALRGIGIESGRENSGDALLDFLERAKILMHVDSHWEFTHPNLIDFFGAGFVSGYGRRWVSLLPRHRRVMQWAAAILARRGDEQRTHAFAQDLKVALRQMSELSWLEVADILAEFQGFESAAVAGLRELVINALTNLKQVKSNRLRQAITERGSRLGIDIGLFNLEQCPEAVIPSADMERIAKGDLHAFLTSLRIRPPAGDERHWLEDRTVLRALLTGLNQPDIELRLQCAAWLRCASLTHCLEIAIDLKNPWQSGPVSALELVAQMSTDPNVDEFTQTLARSILSRDEFMLRLFDLPEVYWPLAYTLLLAVDKRLDSGRRQIVE